MLFLYADTPPTQFLRDVQIAFAEHASGISEITASRLHFNGAVGQ